MKPSLVVILLSLVCLPLGLLVWLGEERTRSEQERARASLESVLQDRLLEVRQRLEDKINGIAVGFDARLERMDDPRGTARTMPLVSQAFMTAGSQVIFPPALDATAGERAFLKRVGPLASLMSHPPRDESGSGRASRAWYTWYYGEGRNFLYWNGLVAPPTVRGFEVDRMAFLSALVEGLPTDNLANGRIVLRDESSYPIYQWGTHEPAAEAAPVVEIAAPSPIESWRLAYFVPPAMLASPATRQTDYFKAALFGVGALVLLLGAYFYWANNRALRDAEQRVSFVNQVSHELKTPLTNIRMYAELAETKLDPEDKETQNCLDVVVSESGRLSRLIQNVLTFAKQQRGTLSLHTSDVCPDDVIRSVIDAFRPALEDAGIAADLKLNAKSDITLDRDVLEQILSNLISNVLKYAADGKHLGLLSKVEATRLVIEVADHGPGIPRKWRRRVFGAFRRLSDRVSDGVAGTGIGLTIARELAQRHGGSLELVDGTRGATFRLTLNALTKPLS